MYTTCTFILNSEEGTECVIEDETIVGGALEMKEGEEEEVDIEGFKEEEMNSEEVPFDDFGDDLGGLGMGESEGFHLYDRDDQELVEVDIEDLSSPIGSLSPSWAESNKDAAIADMIRDSPFDDGCDERQGGGKSEWKLEMDSDGTGDTDISLSCKERFSAEKEALKPSIKEEGEKEKQQQVEFGNLKPSSSIPHPATNPDELYCFCQQPALTHFMIQCHKCSEWFHGSCVGITRHSAAKVKEFYCSMCIDVDPSLVTVFHTKATAEPEEEEREKSTKSRAYANENTTKRSTKKHSRRCGTCVACLCEEDCKKCRFCKDMPKYGGLGRMRQKCIKRQCHKLSRILYAEDPLHSKSRKLHEDIAAELKKVGGRVELTSTSDGEGMSLVPRLSSVSADVSKGGVDGDIAVTTKLKPKHRGRKKPAKRLGGGAGKGTSGKQGVARGNRGRVRLSASDLEIITQEQVHLNMHVHVHVHVVHVHVQCLYMYMYLYV